VTVSLVEMNHQTSALVFTLATTFASAHVVSACSSSDSNDANIPAGGGARTNGGAGAPTAAGGSDESIAGEILSAHNRARAGVEPAPTSPIAPLAWSSEIASAAQAWADGCAFKHSGGKYGENIYASAGSNTTPQNVVDAWVSEVENYDYARNACSGTCGHYTQVIWRNSTKLGCAFRNCTKNSPFSGFSQWQFWVCNYDPPGNFNDEKPY